MPLTENIVNAKAAWRDAQILDGSPSWEGEPIHSHWVERLAGSDDATIDAQLLEIATNETNLVAAYAIETLARRESELLHALPEELLNRPGKLTRQTGSFRERMQFKDFVRSTLRIAKQKKAEQAVAPQSATRSESDSEGGCNPKPESEPSLRYRVPDLDVR